MEKYRETQEMLDKVQRVLRQSPQGKKISDLAKKLGKKRSTVYGYLNTLELRGKAYFQRGTAYLEKPASGKRFVQEPSATVVSSRTKADLRKRYEEILLLDSVDRTRSVAYRKSEQWCHSIPSPYQEKLMPTFVTGKLELGRIRQKWADPFERSREQVKFYKLVMPYVIQRLSETLHEIERGVSLSA